MGSVDVWRLLAIVCLAVLECQTYEWSSRFDGGQIVYSCIGKTVTFPWEFRLGQGEKVLFVRWTFDGAFSSETIATFSEDFLPAVDYTERVKQVGVAGITLEQTKVEDNGNYSVEIGGVTSSGVFFSLSGMSALQVGDKLLVEHEQVKLVQLPSAVKVKDTGRWSIALACGTFEHLGVPPFPVHWTTPSGDVITESSGYEDGHYFLQLANPVRGGNYACEIPPLFADDACLASDRQSAVKATVTVDETLARLSLLEAHQQELLLENEEMKSKLARDTAEIEGLKSRVGVVEESATNSSDMILTLDNQLSRLQGKVTTADCPNGWIRKGDNCYMFMPQVFSWFNAQYTCEKMRSTLAEIDSAEEHYYIAEILLKHGASKAWIGLTDFAQDGVYVWTSTSERPAEPTFWGAGEPGNTDFHGTGCAVLTHVNLQVTWADYSCQVYAFPFVCEKQQA